MIKCCKIIGTNPDDPGGRPILFCGKPAVEFWKLEIFDHTMPDFRCEEHKRDSYDDEVINFKIFKITEEEAQIYEVMYD